VKIAFHSARRLDDVINDAFNSVTHSRLLDFSPTRLGATYAKSFSRSHDAVIRVYGAGGNMIDTHQHAGDFKEW
jgi:hypothetical protein